MKKNEIAPGIIVYENVIKNSHTLVNDIEDGIISAGLNWNNASIYDEGGTGTTTKIDSKIRDTLTIGIPYYDKPINNYNNLKSTFFTNLSNLFLESFSSLEIDYKNQYGIHSTWHDLYGILKYGVGQKFVNHIDDHHEYHRRISTLYYLNEDYEGGEINFPRFDVSIKPKENSMIIFPSTYTYNHSVSEIKKGTRYSIVSWLR
jgi:Rps23 Pro-64 3,4-dihydroxylase Tpa1-like proline 4-hydroxylase